MVNTESHGWGLLMGHAHNGHISLLYTFEDTSSDTWTQLEASKDGDMLTLAGQPLLITILHYERETQT